jgi:ferredoxin
VCEFCTKHGEGKKWYLEMRNYSKEWLAAPLTPEEKEACGASTRAEWLASFCKAFGRAKAAGGQVSLQEMAMAVAPGVVRWAAAGDTGRAFEAMKTVHFGQVVSLEDAESIIDSVDSITRLPCGCRYFTTGKADKRYCFGLGVIAGGMWGAMPDLSSFEALTKDEAKKVIRDYDTEGLVHTVWTAVTPFVLGLCNCDHDCLAYRGYIEERGTPSFFRGESLGEVDVELCSGCKDCVKQCQFGAMFYSSALGKVYIDPTRCFGCGVCRAACPTEAIHMSPRSAHAKVANVWLRYP